MTITNGITIRDPFLTLKKRIDSMKVGDNYTFEAEGHGVNVDGIQWTTSVKGVIVIDKKTGRATAKSTGTDYVIATIGNVSKRWKVVVKQ
jgi:hypothetical protein